MRNLMLTLCISAILVAVGCKRGPTKAEWDAEHGEGAWERAEELELEYSARENWGR